MACSCQQSDVYVVKDANGAVIDAAVKGLTAAFNLAKSVGGSYSKA